MKLKREDVLKIVYGEGTVQRFTQDSPVLPDVWIAYAEKPSARLDLLLTPHHDPRKEEKLSAGKLKVTLETCLEKGHARSASYRRIKQGSPELAYNQSTVAAKLWFDELVRVVLPMSKWWNDRVCEKGDETLLKRLQQRDVQRTIAGLLANPQMGQPAKKEENGFKFQPDVLWTIRVAGTIALANISKSPKSVWPPPLNKGKNTARREAYFLRVVQALAALLKGARPHECDPLVHLVSLNRQAKITIWRSRPAIKADAAVRVFDIDASRLTWAIIDSGIDAEHPAFFRRNGPGNGAPAGKDEWKARTRVLATYDFSIIRALLSTDPAITRTLPARVKRKLLADPNLRNEVRRRLKLGYDVDWAVFEPLIQISHEEYQPPPHEHGTHVAGILGANWSKDDPRNPSGEDIKGICPDINLYDLRVLGRDGDGDEFNVIAALQFARYLNANKGFTVLHGVNLSLSIRHDVLNYACGRTPVCDECERLVGNGLVVVAAAGNDGYRMTTDDPGGYRSISITDPGNAEAVITVGATHRDAPHTYGVSYFSSRGPTGDGRIKPDLVAPGEKIESCVPGGEVKRLDGTSMAAPHVSGAAALLMARHAELIGRPQRIKQILCDTATDLGRERYFQGRGMVDAFRALQAV